MCKCGDWGKAGGETMGWVTVKAASKPELKNEYNQFYARSAIGSLVCLVWLHLMLL